MTEPTKLTFSSLADVIAHLEQTGKDVVDKTLAWRSQVQELTGHKTSEPITPLDVVKIVQKVFFESQGGSDGRDTRPVSGGEPGGGGLRGGEPSRKVKGSPKRGAAQRSLCALPPESSGDGKA